MWVNINLNDYSIDEHGGKVITEDKDGKSLLEFGAGKHGGDVTIRDKEGNSLVSLEVIERGGLVVARGKDSKAQAWIGIDDPGNGSVSMLDKNGNKQKTQ